MQVRCALAAAVLLLHSPAVMAAEGVLLAVATAPEAREALRAGISGLAGVEAVADVGRRQLHLVRSRNADGDIVQEAPAGFRYLLDGLLFDPPAYARLLGEEQELLRSLKAGDALLSESSARLRRTGKGGALEMADGSVLTVRGVVPDALILNREIAVALPGYDGAGDRRNLWFRFSGPLDGLEDELSALLPTDVPLRLRSLDEADFVEGYAPILPQARLKLALGEFAIRPTTGTAFQRDARWEGANIVFADVPLLGRVRCHRLVVPALKGAMEEVIARGLDHLIAPRAFQGCDNPRLIGDGRGPSRHAWGAAVDINYSADRVIRANGADSRLVEIMAKWGFLSGHLFNDPGHFEYAGPPVR